MQATSHNWNDLSEIIDVANLNQSDEKCLAELQAVIEKHGLEQKFGVSLLHKHFDIGNDEMLVETNSPSKQTLTLKPMAAAEVEADKLITTIWRFDGGVRYGCAYCNKDHCQKD